MHRPWEIQSFDEYKTVIDSDKAVVLNFYSSGFDTLEPPLDIARWQTRYPNIPFYNVNIFQQVQVARANGFSVGSSLPTLVIFHKGSTIDSLTRASGLEIARTLDGLPAKLKKPKKFSLFHWGGRKGASS